MVDKEIKTNVNPLEQFILLAKSARGAALISLVNQVLETTGIYVFGELLNQPNIQEVEKFFLNDSMWCFYKDNIIFQIFYLVAKRR